MIASLLRLCPEDLEIVLADIGSAGGLKNRWKPLRTVVSGLLFEPREGGEVRRQGRDRLYPVALGPAAGQATLNLTALPNMSSTLEPNAALLDRFQKKGSHVVVTGSIDMTVETLDAVAAREGIAIDALKVDTQGSELGILEGAAQTLSSTTFLAEVELSFLDRYRDQPRFGDVEAFLRARHFELIDIFRLKRYRYKNSAKLTDVSLRERGGRLAYCDGLFLLSEDKLLERIRALPPPLDEGLLLKAALCLMVYRKADLAARLVDLCEDRIGNARRASLRRYFARLARAPYWRQPLDLLRRRG